MDLPLDPTLPLGGIALILLLVWLTGGRHSLRLAGEADAIRLLAAPETGFAAAETVVSQDGGAALARDRDGRIAAVFGSGAHLAARRLGRGDIAAVTLSPQPDGSVRLLVRTTAFTHPDFLLQLDAATAETWRRHLQAVPA